MQEQLWHLDVRQAHRQLTSARICLVALCVAAAMLSGCARKHFEWKEQVQLSDGTTVEVERSIRYGKVLRELGGPTSAWISEAMVTVFDHGKRLPTWSHAMEPFIINRDKASGKWTIVANARDYCEYAARFGSPVPTFLAFELNGTDWKYIGLPEEIVGQRANLLLGVPGKNHGPELSAYEVSVANEHRLGLREYLTVDSRRLNLCASDMARTTRPN